MSLLSAIPLVGQIVTSLMDVIDKKVEDKDLSSKLKSDLQLSLLEKDYSFVETEIKAQAEIVAAEAKGASYLQRNWRPILMLVFTYIIAHNYVVSPLFSVPRTEIPPDMWELLKLGMGGYILGRTAEKGIEAWKK